MASQSTTVARSASRQNRRSAGLWDSGDTGELSDTDMGILLAHGVHLWAWVPPGGAAGIRPVARGSEANTEHGRTTSPLLLTHNQSVHHTRDYTQPYFTGRPAVMGPESRCAS